MMDGDRDPLARALIALDTPPAGPGWNHAEMADLLGEGRRTPAAVMLGFRDDRQQRLVLTVRTHTLSEHAGQVALPGGRIDAGDASVVAAALREAEEEIGLSPSAVRPLGFLDTYETVSGFLITPVVARIDAGARLRPAPDEVAEIFEVPLAFFQDPANVRRYTIDFRGHRRDMVEFIHAGHRIWGATAAILLNLLRRMGHA